MQLKHFDRAKEPRLYQLASYIASLEARLEKVEQFLAPKKRGRPRKNPE